MAYRVKSLASSDFDRWESIVKSESAIPPSLNGAVGCQQQPVGRVALYCGPLGVLGLGACIVPKLDRSSIISEGK